MSKANNAKGCTIKYKYLGFKFKTTALKDFRKLIHKAGLEKGSSLFWIKSGKKKKQKGRQLKINFLTRITLASLS